MPFALLLFMPRNLYASGLGWPSARHPCRSNLHS